MKPVVNIVILIPWKWENLDISKLKESYIVCGCVLLVQCQTTNSEVLGSNPSGIVYGHVLLGHDCGFFCFYGIINNLIGCHRLEMSSMQNTLMAFKKKLIKVQSGLTGKWTLRRTYKKKTTFYLGLGSLYGTCLVFENNTLICQCHWLVNTPPSYLISVRIWTQSVVVSCRFPW